MKQSNRVKAVMRAGRKAYGYNLPSHPHGVIDILGKRDFDFVFIDGEHGPFGLDQLEDLCRTAERQNVTTIARVPDIGSSTSCPISIVGSWAYWAHTSRRRWTPASSCGRSTSVRSVSGHSGQPGAPTTMPGLQTRRRTTAKQTNRCWCGALLEDVAVLNNLDAILSVPGTDLYNIGPNNFAQSLGYPGQPDHRKLSRQCRRAQVASDRLAARCDWT
jgi:2-keto-3-deoxy-L-rhamnonate aldolase RhmA